MVMTRNGQKPQYELWCQQNASITSTVTKTIYVTAVMMSLLLLPPIGVIASSNFNGNNASIATIENNTNFTNNSHNNGTINELVVSKTIHTDAANAEHVVMVEPSLSSLSLTRNNDSSGSSIVPMIDGAVNGKTTGAHATTTAATIASAGAVVADAASTPSNVDIIHTTISPLTNGEITSRMQTSQFIAGSNTRRDSPSTSSTLPITTNKPHVSTFADSMLRQKVAAHTRQYQSKHHHEHHYSGPFFEGPLNTSAGALNVAQYTGTEGVFNCRVGMLKDKTVMWVRRTIDKFSLLSVGNITHTGDPRIKVTFQYPNNWRLHINPIQKEDAGLYHCQVSTHPPRVFTTNVTVMPPAIRVVDEQGNEIRDRYYKIGSKIDLTCQVATNFITKNSTTTAESKFSLLQRYIDAPPEPPTPPPTLFPPISAFDVRDNEIDMSERATIRTAVNDSLFRRIKWTKDGDSVSKEAIFNLSSTGGWITSRLSILSAERQHSGIYACSIINSTTATVDVQILNGETPAAVQHSVANQISHIYVTLQALASILIVLYISC
ncbi:uncharacterized protein LOC116349159 [Contarinia nasturtii]|uniref:uncharacterized protein LOC116349159 n=1 Tax=Contarinia nasturtii TaxID=265458 RepID=UPI0012D48D3B|nr:uncharacterized protein LOC116349159 [Contarinia nasturtii]